MARVSVLDSTGYAAFVDVEAMMVELYGDISSLSASGIAYAVTPKTADYSIVAGDMAGHKIFTNHSAVGDVEYTLGAGVANQRVSFYVGAAQALKVTADGSEKFRYQGQQSAGGDTIQSSTVGTFWTIFWDGTEWVLSSLKGTVSYTAGSFSGAPVATVVPKTADYTLTAADLFGNKTFTNIGDADASNYTWPTLAEGQACGFYVAVAQYLRITAPAGKKLRWRGIQSAAAGYARSNVIGNYVWAQVINDEIYLSRMEFSWKLDE